MIVPLNNGRGMLQGGAVTCKCCAEGNPLPPPPPVPGLDIRMASATSAGGNLSCAMGPVVKTFDNLPPYNLPAGSYQLRVDFTTGDNLYHVGSYYELNLTFTPATADIVWSLFQTGTAGNPWTITNSGRTLRYSVEDSAGLCGGPNANIQTGVALATITASAATAMGFDFNGIAELESSGFENITFYLRSL